MSSRQPQPQPTTQMPPTTQQPQPTTQSPPNPPRPRRARAITTLTAKGARYLKVFDNGQTLRSYDTHHTQFTPRFWMVSKHNEHPRNGLTRIYRLLKHLEGKRDTFIVRGHPRPEVLAKIKAGEIKEINRRYRARPGKGAPDFTPDDSRAWICVDIDGLELEPTDPVVKFMQRGRTPEDVNAYLKAIILEALPKEFHDVECVCQLSSSAGLKGDWSKAKVHLWYLLDKPVCGRAARDWFRRHQDKQGCHKGIDLSLFSPSQPHYTCSPLFTDSANDPLQGEQRTYFVRSNRNASVVITPDCARAYADWLANQPENSPEALQVRGELNQRATAKMRNANRIMTHVRHHFATTVEGDRHSAIRDKAIWVGKLIARGEVTPGMIGRDFLEACTDLYDAQTEAQRVEDLPRIVRECMTLGLQEGKIEIERIKALARDIEGSKE